uniref:FUSC family protein n=1 Tax=Meloidogyne hapla TaxID=6305 RepID=A0A1I8B374_MELHA
MRNNEARRVKQKAYAQAGAIVGAAFGSWLLFDFLPNKLFLFGTLMVAVSVYLYNGYPQERKNKEDENSKLINTFSSLYNRLGNEVENDFEEKNGQLLN